jgi:hypothetical protein
MISLKKGNPVAVIYTGKDEGKKIFITNDSGDTELKQDPLELFGNHELAPSKKLMSAAQRRAIRTALLDDRRDYPSELEDHMESLRELYDRKNRYEYRTDSETLCVYPSKESERVFVAGKSGSGKSTFTAQYIREYTEMYPKRSVFLISTHEDEKAYRILPINQIALDETFLEKPPTLNDLAQSLVVFDDTDNLQDKGLQQAVQALNSDLLANGRKYEIHVITLAHQLMDYSRSRTLLNEANRVVFFTGGSAYHIQRYLKVYAGLQPRQIRRILDSKSRWTCLGLTIPNYVVTEHEVYVLKNDQS